MNPGHSLNVLHLISSFQMGGAEKLLLELVAQNAKAGEGKVSFTVVVMNDLVSEELKAELEATGCDVIFLQRPPRHRHPKYLLTLLGIIRRKNIQMIHSHNFGSKMWAILCKMVFPRLKLIFTIHDTNIVKNLSRFHVFLHKHMIDRNIAISESVRKECTERNITNTAKIYNGIQFNKFHDFRKQDCLFGEEVKIVNVARITHRKKGQDVLVRAVKECELKGLDVTCSFVGGVYDYDKGSLAYLTELAGELGVQDRIRFLGNVNDVNRLLPEFDLFVLPSRYEGLGLVVLEAMAAGLPVISSDIDGPAELIRHGGNGYLFESENAADLADQIIRVAREQEALRQVVTNATEFVKSFDIAIMLERYAALYEELRS